MAKALGILLLIPALAEKASHEGSCDDSALMQMNRNKGKLDQDGIPSWVLKKILDNPHKGYGYHYPTTTTAAPDPGFSCSLAEPQAPRNVTESFVGLQHPRVKPIGIEDEFPNLIHVNTHFHLGGEHCNFDNNEYALNVDQAFTNPADIIPNDIRPGFFCAPVDEEPSRGTLDPYEFQWCKNVSVGYTYEFHWVFSSAGPLDGILTGGLGGVFARSLNPSAMVRGQVVRIVNDPEEQYMQFNTTWKPVTDYMLYVGSTTSDNYDNEKCSPVEVTWWVDRQCKELSAQVLDRTCKDLLDFGVDMENDVKPASSREIVADFISDKNATITVLS